MLQNDINMIKHDSVDVQSSVISGLVCSKEAKSYVIVNLNRIHKINE